MSTVYSDQPDSIGSIVKLIEVLNDIDLASPDAKENEIAIEDSNGGKIIL